MEEREEKEARVGTTIPPEWEVGSSNSHAQSSSISVKQSSSEVDLDDIYESVTTNKAAEGGTHSAAVSSGEEHRDKEMDKEKDKEKDKDKDEAALVVFSRKYLRVSFIGLAEKCDEWIALDSDRIQRLNTFSFGRRGDNPIREEVSFISSFNRMKDAVPSTTSVALYSDRFFVEKLYVKIVHAFGANQGYQALYRILNFAASDTTGQAVGGEVVVPPTLVPFESVLQLMIAAGNSSKVLSQDFLFFFSPPFLQCCSYILSRMTLAHIRETSVEVMESVFNAIEHLAIVAFGRSEDTGKLIEPLKLDMCLRLIACPYLNRRLGGLKILTELLKRANNAVDCPTGWRIHKSVTPSGEHSASYSALPILYYLRPALISEKLIDIIPTLFESKYCTSIISFL